MYSPFPFNPYQFQQPTLPQQQVIQANGKASVDALRMAPNSSVLVMDSTAPIVWLCTSDGLGNVSSTPYDISVHKDAPKPDSLEQRLAAAEANISQIMEVLNGKPDAWYSKPESSGKSDRPDQTGV